MASPAQIEEEEDKMKIYPDGVTCGCRTNHPREGEWLLTQEYQNYEHLVGVDYLEATEEAFSDWLERNPLPEQKGTPVTDNKDCKQSASKESNRLTGDRVFRLTCEAMMDELYHEYPDYKGNTVEWFVGWIEAARRAADLIDEQNKEKAG